MNRIIDRDRAIDVAIRALKWAANQGEQVDEEEATEAIATLTTPAPAGQVVEWIQVTESLPEPYETVLLWVDDYVCIGWAHKWKDSAIGWTGIGYDINVFPTHWQPLPEAPK